MTNEDTAKQYLLLIFNQEKDWATANDAQREKILQGHAALEKHLRQSGKYKFLRRIGGRQHGLLPCASVPENI